MNGKKKIIIKKIDKDCFNLIISINEETKIIKSLNISELRQLNIDIDNLL